MHIWNHLSDGSRLETILFLYNSGPKWRVWWCNVKSPSLSSDQMILSGLWETSLALKTDINCWTMVIANATGGGKHTESFSQQLCSVSLTDGIHGELIFIATLDVILSITAFLGNTLILIALRKESSLHPPSKVLFNCLATTDLCVGLIVQPIHVSYLISRVQEKWDFCPYAVASHFIACYTLSGVSLLTVTGKSVDRLLAALLGLRYRQVVTLKRTYVLVVLFWVVSILAATSYLINDLITFWYGYIVISLCVVISMSSYTKIFFTLRRHQTEVQNHTQQPSQGTELNLARYRRAVFSTLWVQCALVVCYLPYCIVSACFRYGRKSHFQSYFLAWELTITLAYLNSSLNPFLYCWKISEVKQAVKKTIREMLYCS